MIIKFDNKYKEAIYPYVARDNIIKILNFNSPILNNWCYFTPVAFLYSNNFYFSNRLINDVLNMIITPTIQSLKSNKFVYRNIASYFVKKITG